MKTHRAAGYAPRFLYTLPRLQSVQFTYLLPASHALPPRAAPRSRALHAHAAAALPAPRTHAHGTHCAVLCLRCARTPHHLSILPLAAHAG